LIDNTNFEIQSLPKFCRMLRNAILQSLLTENITRGVVAGTDLTHSLCRHRSRYRTGVTWLLCCKISAAIFWLMIQ